MHRFVFLIIALTLHSVANATSTASFTSMSCSGNLSSSLAGDASYVCAGDLSVIGGNIISDSKILLQADGNLFMGNISLDAPIVELTSLNGATTFGNDVFISSTINTTINSGGLPFIVNSDPIIIHGPVISGKVTLMPGGDITLTPSVPEPNSYLLMMIGLGMLITFRARSKQNKKSEYL